jgi:hypothetical protein
MHRYLVADVSKSNRLVALRDPSGRFHVAHCTSELPAIQAVLDGFSPAIGFALLTGPRGEVVRLIFSHVHCGHSHALALLHAEGESVRAQQRGA